MIALRRPATWPLAALLLLGVPAACEESEAATATYSEIACPADVEVAVVPPHTCGEVTITPVEGPDVRLFVTQVEPPEPSDRAPVLETGTDVGMVPGYGGLAPVAQRTGRRLIIVDLAGTGHSTPSLACPEVDAAGPRATSALEDPSVLDAVASCRSRLEEAGVDPALGRPESLADQLAHVVRALGLDRVVGMGHGTTAGAAVAFAERHPELVEAVVLDSLSTPVTDTSTPVLSVVREVARACRTDQSCLAEYGDVDDLWRRSVDRSRTAPLSVRGVTDVVLHEAELQRAVRWLVAPVSRGPTLLPALLREAAQGRPGPQLSGYALARTAGTPLCAGYLPKCEGAVAPAVGAVLSAQCPQPPGSEWGAACAAWGADEWADEVRPVRDIPALALVGRFNPFATPEQAREHLTRVLPDAHVVEDPVSGHNVLGTDCMRRVRNDWLEEPSAAPPEPDCLNAHLAWP